MKKILLFSGVGAAVIALVASCGNKETVNWKEAIAELQEQAEAAYSDSTLTTDAQKDSVYYSILQEAFDSHKEDSLGLYAFTELMRDSWDLDRVRSEYESACDLIKNNDRVKQYAGLRENGAKTGVGTQYVDIEGEEALEGSPLKLSDFVGNGKPTLVDFWASWCGPCRRAIKDHVAPFYAENSEKANVVGIAVWEDSVDDTRKAMSELGVSWPIIYTGGRGEESPATAYGVTGIPTLMVLSPEGTILYKGFGIEGALEALTKAME